MSIREDLAVHEIKAKIFATYLGVVTTVLLPLTIGGATWWINKTQFELTCVKESLGLVDKLYRDDGVGSDRRDAWRSDVASHGELLSVVCGKVDITMPRTFFSTLSKVVVEAKDPAVASSALAALEAAAATARSAASSSEPATSSANLLARQATDAVTDAKSAPPPRVYFHISDSGQRDDAAAVERRLEREKIKNEAIVVPGIERAPIKADTAVLRCFRTKECEEAGLILVELRKIVATPAIEIQDLSARYESATNIRARHYELWFPLGPIALKAVSQ